MLEANYVYYIGKEDLVISFQGAANGNCIFTSGLSFEYPALGPRGLVPANEGALSSVFVDVALDVHQDFPKRAVLTEDAYATISAS